MDDASDRLERLERVVLEAAAHGDADGSALAGTARRAAASLLTEEPSGELVARRFVAAALTHLALAGALTPAAAAALLAELPAAEHAGVELAALGDPVLAALPIADALAATGTLLACLAGVDELSAWRTDLAGRLARVHEDGRPAPADEARGLARRCLLDRAAVQGPAARHATPVRAFSGVAAALVWRAPETTRARLLVEQAAATLAAPLQLALTIDDNLDAHRALVQAPERRLTRLALDLHDGALQDAALVAGELRRLEDELRPALRGRPEGEPVRATLETIASLVEALDADLREVATTIEGPSMLKRPFAEAIEAVVAAFRNRARIAVDLAVTGDLGAITDSQRIALFRVVQESLANVRQHADAQSVAITIAGHGTHVELSVIDDGLGFEPESAVDRAGREGRLGLVGMVERVRLLGGRCEISSQPGRGTSIRARIARYEPLPDRRA